MLRLRVVKVEWNDADEPVFMEPITSPLIPLVTAAGLQDPPAFAVLEIQELDGSWRPVPLVL